METNKESKKRTVIRSPKFPGVALEEACERATQLYDSEQHNAFKGVAVEVAARYWQYSTKSSGLRRLIAALKRYGLATNVKVGGVKGVKLTDLARQIVADRREGSPDRAKALKKAALTPKIFKELWKGAGGTVPSDVHMEWVLENQYSFNRNAIPDFIQNFKATVSFAQLTEADVFSGTEETNEEDDDESELFDLPPTDTNGQTGAPQMQQPTETPTPPSQAATPSQGRPIDYPILLGNGSSQATLRVPMPLSKTDYQLLKLALKYQLKVLGMSLGIPEDLEDDDV